MLLILGLAAFFRFWRLADMPPGLYHDEAYYGLDALSLTQGKTFPQFYEGWELYQHDAHANRPATATRWPVFFEGNYGREPLHIYLVALTIKLFGATPFAIRAVPALLGTLAVLTTFLAAKALFNIQEWKLPPANSPPPHAPFTILTPLVAAFTLAILFPAVHFSRFGLRLMTFVPVATLAIYCFWKGSNNTTTERHSQNSTLATSSLPALFWFTSAGFLLGLGLYTYAAGRLFPLLFALFVPLWFWQDRAALRRHWLHVGLMAGTAVLIALPLLVYFWRYPYFFVFRMAFVANKGAGVVAGKPWLTWLYNTWRVLAGLFWQGETHLRHNLPARPYLDPLQALFFLAGIFSVSKRLLHPRIFFLCLWLLIMLLPTLLSGDAPHFGRMSGAAPAIAIFVGMGVDWLGNVAARPLRGRLAASGNRFTAYRFPLTVYHLLLIPLLASAVWAGYDYFSRYANHPQLAADFYLPEWQMGQYAAAFAPDTAVYLTPTQEELATIYYALGGPERLQNYAGEAGAVPLGTPGQAALYLVRPSAVASLRTLQTRFPDSEPGAAGNGYIPFYVPAAAPRLLAENKSEHLFGSQIRLAGWAVEEENGATAVTLIWQARTAMERDYTVFVHLIGPDGLPAAQLDRQPGGYPTSDWRPGEWVLDTYTVPLPPGLALENVSVQTGFYYLPTLERLGEPARLK